MTKALDRLLELLDLEQIEVNIFRGRSPDERRQRVFGGQVAGQALVAAGRTVPADRPVHSLHAYFIRPGDPAVPLVYTVDRVRDGRSFTTRRVSAIQHGKTIFTLSASFHHPEPGLDHADPMPDVPPPEMVERTSDRLARLLGQLPPQMADNPIDLRSVGPLSVEAERDPSLRTTKNLVWLRVDGELPDDPLLHVCLMTYASDMTLLDSVLLGHGLSWVDGRTSGASLDHAMWFHRPFRADRWLLYAQDSPVAHGAREWTSQDVRPGAGLRLYRAGAGSHSILAKDGQPDHRISVPLTLWTATGSSRSTALTCAWTLLATRPTRRSCSSAAWAARWTGGRRNSASGWRRAGDLSSGMTIVTPGGRSAIQPGRRGTRARTWRPMWSGCWTRSGGGALTWPVSRWAVPSRSRSRWLIPIASTRWC